MTDRWTDRLSEYLDGDLVGGERAELDAHLASCAECGAILADLRAVSERARNLETPALATDLWPGIAERIANSERRPVEPAREAARGGIVRMRPWARQFTFSLPQAAAAVLALTLLSGGSVWWAMHQAAPAPAPSASVPVASQPSASAPTATPTLTGPSAEFAGFDPRHYDSAIAELETDLRQHRAQLDTSTVRIVEQNLVVIDRAIGEARRALAADPASAYLNGHLARQLRLKLDLLRRVTDFPGARG